MRPLRAVIGVLSLLAVSVFPGCAVLLSAKAPLDRIDYRQPGHHDTLLVLLPGMGDHAADFDPHGFIRAVSARHLPVDMVAVDAHFAYYAQRNIIERLHADIIQPARARGYRHIWLAGISLGGLGALLYTQAYPADITGVLLLAPYLGNAQIIREVAHQPEPGNWRTDDADEQAPFRSLWRWLAARAQQAATARPPLYLAFGHQDRLAAGHRQLARLLPAQQVLELPGRHDWPTWQRLWACLLDQRPFAGQAPFPPEL